MKIKIAGTQIHITFLFFACILLLMVLDKSGYILPMILGVTAHETAHLITMRILGCAPKEIRLIPGSVQIVRDIQTVKKNEILISLSGPIINTLLFTFFYAFYCIFKRKVLLDFALINLILGIFNMLPVKMLDGGAVLSNLLLYKMPQNRVNIVMRCTSFLFFLATLVFGVWLFIKTEQNFSLIILSIYFLLSFLIKI